MFAILLEGANVCEENNNVQWALTKCSTPARQANF